MVAASAAVGSHPPTGFDACGVCGRGVVVVDVPAVLAFALPGNVALDIALTNLFTAVMSNSGAVALFADPG
jgi:hypothetical protein